MRLSKYNFFYLFVIILIYSLIELLSYFILLKLDIHGIYPKFNLTKNDVRLYNKSNDVRLGWELESNLSNNYGGKKIINSEKYDLNCIEVYGDSFTESVDVDTKFSWPSLLAEKLNCRVINFGVRAYGTDQSLINYKNKNKISDIVIINHFSENIVRNINQFRNLIYPTEKIFLKPRFILKNNKIELVKIPILESTDKNKIYNLLEHEYFLPGKETGIINGINFSYTYNLYVILTSHHKFRAFFKNEPHSKQFYNINHKSNALEITFLILKEFNNLAIKKKQTPLVTIIPHCKDLKYYKDNKRIPYQNLIYKLDLEKILYLDFLPEIFLRSPNFKELYNNDCEGQHFNEKGNIIISEILYDFLKKNL
jgi:hypothetical protein